MFILARAERSFPSQNVFVFSFLMAVFVFSISVFLFANPDHSYLPCQDAHIRLQYYSKYGFGSFYSTYQLSLPFPDFDSSFVSHQRQKVEYNTVRDHQGFPPFSVTHLKIQNDIVYFIQTFFLWEMDSHKHIWKITCFIVPFDVYSVMKNVRSQYFVNALSHQTLINIYFLTQF